MQVRIQAPINNNGATIAANIDFIQTALSYFLENARIPIYFGSQSISLMEYLPLCHQGYALGNTLQLLVLIYALINNLTTVTPGAIVGDPYTDIIELLSVIPDELMNTAFGGSIPAYYAKYRFEGEITMQEAVDERMIPNYPDHYLNTFEVIQREGPILNLGMFPLEVCGLMSEINAQRQLPLEFKSYFDSPDFRNTAAKELRIVLNLYLVLIDKIEPELRATGLLRKIEKITDIDLMKYSMRTNFRMADVNVRDLLDAMLADNRSNKLVYAILSNNLNDVKLYINMYDPRDNNLEIYHLAVSGKNQAIINLVEKAIIERNALEQRTFQTMMVPLGESDIPQTEMFRQYGRSLLK
jgi:hypothetical protein